MRSGWDLYRQENKGRIEGQGYTGKNIVSKLGENWKKLKPEDKNKYKRRSYALSSLNLSPKKLEKSKSCCKTGSCGTLEKRKSLQ